MSEAGGAGAWPIVLIEVVLVFGGVLAFAWWQIRDVRRAREQSRLEAARAAQEALAAGPGKAPAPAATPAAQPAGAPAADAGAAGRVRIATLGPADLVAYRALMLQAYEQAPDAFVSTAEERRAEPLQWWLHRMAPPSGLGQSFGAFVDGTLVGTVALEYSARAKARHAGLVVGMYVQPEARRLGLGRQLLQAAVAAAAARPGLRQLGLTVTEGNAAALALYEQAGFVAWGVEPMALRTGSGWRGKVHMALRLPGGDSAD